ncbi:MAG: hydrogenase maturation nickel metallochaperone HypA [Anaerolineae bacterium]|nr:hydrogenase maturation nickel metallochaperone HypA [Anaerolineae bacterium]NUQ03322.1 hydrogenase maturation nickel metallochaperone HypA [Anaerolineae bacterium]
MHELSIAHNLIEIAAQAAEAAGVDRIQAVQLKLGALSGVEKDALLFCYAIAAEGTRLQGSRLEIAEIPVAIYCPRCDDVLPLDGVQALCCPRCGTPSADIRQGYELEVISLEYESSDEPAASS